MVNKKVSVDKNCLFCKLVNEASTKATCPYIIYEDEKIIALLDRYPIYKGQTIVCFKQHYWNLSEVPDEDLAKIMPLIKKISRMLGFNSFNLRMGSGPASEVLVPHLYFEIIPKNESSNAKLNANIKCLNLSDEEWKNYCNDIQEMLKRS